ncbi:flavin reductase [Tepiditoga spiralis]|uniref:Flavin reductase n=1 Tax=Tepiditoga spiralis TaxID=2108365 RepID=A0A7G1G7W4_9BACT|nr:flavin reductase family protein [Tepiditoga spiralis]BBE30102.1 flavin reductase [Tepiditoga spiralis]
MDIKSFYRNIALPVCTVMAGDEKNYNIMTVAWSTPLSINPTLFGFAIKKTRYTYDFLTKYKEYSVTFYNFEDSKMIEQIGRISGREFDKIKNLNIEIVKSNKIKTPYVRGYFSFECVLNNIINVGDHDFVVGEVIEVHENLNNNFNPSLYVGKDRYSTINSSKVYDFNTLEIVNELRKNRRNNNV